MLAADVDVLLAKPDPEATLDSITSFLNSANRKHARSPPGDEAGGVNPQHPAVGWVELGLVDVGTVAKIAVRSGIDLLSVADAFHRTVGIDGDWQPKHQTFAMEKECEMDHRGMHRGVWTHLFEGATAKLLNWKSGPAGVWLLQGATGVAK